MRTTDISPQSALARGGRLRRLRVLGTHLALFGMGVAVTLVIIASGHQSATGADNSAAHRPDFTVSRIKASMVTDFSQDTRLAGFADHVFVGRVLAKQGQTLVDELPETQWTVEVVKVYKGTIDGTVVVNQQGGFIEESNTLLLHEGDALLDVGSIYLFATRVNTDRGWHTLVPGFGDLNLGEVVTTQQVAQVDARWQRAVAQQIPFKSGD